MKHKRKHKHNEPRRNSGRKKAFWLLIILGVAVMGVYILAFQDSSDMEFREETTPAANQLETE